MSHRFPISTRVGHLRWQRPRLFQFGSGGRQRSTESTETKKYFRFDDLKQVIDYQSTNELFIDDQHRIPRQRGRRLGADGPRVPGDGRAARGPRLGPNQLPRSLRRRLLPSRIVLSRVKKRNKVGWGEVMNGV